MGFTTRRRAPASVVFTYVSGLSVLEVVTTSRSRAGRRRRAFVPRRRAPALDSSGRRRSAPPLESLNVQRLSHAVPLHGPRGGTLVALPLLSRVPQHHDRELQPLRLVHGGDAHGGVVELVAAPRAGSARRSTRASAPWRHRSRRPCARRAGRARDRASRRCCTRCAVRAVDDRARERGLLEEDRARSPGERSNLRLRSSVTSARYRAARAALLAVLVGQVPREIAEVDREERRTEQRCSATPSSRSAIARRPRMNWRCTSSCRNSVPPADAYGTPSSFIASNRRAASTSPSRAPRRRRTSPACSCVSVLDLRPAVLDEPTHVPRDAAPLGRADVVGLGAIRGNVDRKEPHVGRERSGPTGVEIRVEHRAPGCVEGRAVGRTSEDVRKAIVDPGDEPGVFGSSR